MASLGSWKSSVHARQGPRAVTRDSISRSLVTFEIQTGVSTTVTVVMGVMQLTRFGWSGRAWTREPAAREELLQRDGEVLGLVQGQLGESQHQLLKQQQEASNHQHHSCF